MRLDLYQAESARIANEQMALLAEAKQRILSEAPLSRLEQSGGLHALQVLIQNAIGKSKHLLKAAGQPVPVSAYDTFASLEQQRYKLTRVAAAEFGDWIAQQDCV